MTAHFLSLFPTLFLSLLFSFSPLPSAADRHPDRSGQLASMRQSVWAEWCASLQASQPLPPLGMQPLSEGNVTAWEIPDS